MQFYIFKIKHIYNLSDDIFLLIAIDFLKLGLTFFLNIKKSTIYILCSTIYKSHLKTIFVLYN